MSSLDFTKILESIPKRGTASEALESWGREHPDIAAVPVMDLLSDLHDKIKVNDLLAIINALVREGKLRKVYRVVDPTMKVLLPDSYNSPGDIPERVLDNSDRFIEVGPQDVAMVIEGND